MVTDRRAFGERLKRQRERRGITLAQIAQTTKVSASLFASLEAGDCSRWPAGLYARAYLRAYAAAIGLNADEAVEDFTAAFGTVGQADGTVATAASSARAGSLRLSMVEEPSAAPARLARRAGLAAVELVIGFLIAAVAHVGAGASLWMTVTLVLSYFVAGRVVSDEPLLYWVLCRARQQIIRPTPPQEAKPADVPVGDLARVSMNP